MYETTGSQLREIVNGPDLGITGEWEQFRAGTRYIDARCIGQALEHICAERYFPRLFEEAARNENRGPGYSASIIDEFSIDGPDGRKYDLRLFLAVGEGYGRRCLGTLTYAYFNGRSPEEIDLVRFDGVRPREPKN
ncbi:hypothetical protein KY363_07600 [Candidatus Woesearchaeota archaeon]|nr:hypothetical protein [Candidatus Woesearchaeota archaeon]